MIFQEFSINFNKAVQQKYTELQFSYMIRRQYSLMKAVMTSFIAYRMSNGINTAPDKQSIQYDLAVIGGGSGGLSAAFQASKYGLKVIVIDYVDPSPQGTKWGLGGTCVNVGCIPKKLMHQASLLGQSIQNSYDYGWELPNHVNSRQNGHQLRQYFKWQKLRSALNSYIKSLNFGYLSTINKLQNVSYLNAMATFVDNQTLLCSKDTKLIRQFVHGNHTTDSIVTSQDTKFIKAKNILIATGTRPSYLDIQGANLAVSSDDIFLQKKPPGKTLVVGGGYVAVQLAGMLNGLGFPTTIMTRQIYLRSFDRDMVEQVIQDLAKRKVNIVPTSLPTKIVPNNQKLQVTYQNQQTKEETTDNFDTVIFAVGRKATTNILNLQKVGVKTLPNGKITTKLEDAQATDAENIYAIGDVVADMPELTSTVMKIGAALARRIAENLGYAKFSENQKKINLEYYPTTIFAPLQYSTCGLSEQQAIKRYKEQNIEIYRLKFTPLQEDLLEKYDDMGSSLKNMSFMKVIVRKNDQRVIGLHYTGPNAGQVMQGFSVAVKIGLTKSQLDSSIGIHPTVAENFTQVSVSKSSGQDYIKTSC